MYIFETTATMKDYNAKKWWIDSDIVRPVEICADSLKSAIEKWRGIVIDRDFIDISKNALKTKTPMYIDKKNGPMQVGYVITGKMEFDKGDYSGYSTQYIDLWVTIRKVEYISFDDETWEE